MLAVISSVHQLYVEDFLSQLCVGQIVKRVTSMCKDVHITLPSQEEMLATAGRMMAKFGLPRLALGVDGMHARMESAPCCHCKAGLIQPKEIFLLQLLGDVL